MNMIEVNEGVFINENTIRQAAKREYGNIVYTSEGEFVVTDTVFSILTASAKDKAAVAAERAAKKAAITAGREARKAAALAKKAAFVPYAERKRRGYETVKAWLAARTEAWEGTVRGLMTLSEVSDIKDNVMGRMIEEAPIRGLMRRRVPGRWYVYIFTP